MMEAQNQHQKRLLRSFQQIFHLGERGGKRVYNILQSSIRNPPWKLLKIPQSVYLGAARNLAVREASVE